MKVQIWSVGATLLLIGAVASCGTKSESVFGTSVSNFTGTTENDAGTIIWSDDAGAFTLDDGSTSNGEFSVNQSSPQTLTVTMGQPAPTLQFVGTVGGTAVNTTYVIDQASIATISSTGLLTPTGSAAGPVNVTCTYGSTSVIVQVNVVLTGTQNGPLAGEPLPTQGAGGYGGVGGEGVGPAVSDQRVLAALNGTPAGTAASQGLTLLYPYNGTVWPQGLLAPLLQWSSTPAGVTGIRIQLTSSNGNFNWSGTFAAPAGAFGDAGPGAFIRHPILQDVWTAATNSAGGSNTLTMSLTVATGTGSTAAAYGPVTSTWTIAQAALTGTIYYNSYGTNLVTSSVTASTGVGFGGAVLAIQSGASAPTVAAGYNSPSNQVGCRVCHVVAGGGGALISQQGSNYSSTWAYTPGTTPADAGTLLYGSTGSTGDGTFGWAGLSYDGTLALTNAASMSGNATYTALYPFPPTGTTAVAYDAGGLPSTLKAGLPVFSTDTSRVAFTNLVASSSSPQIPGITCTYDCLVTMSFNRSTFAFSNPIKLVDANTHVGFATFMPTNDAVLFQYALAYGSGGQYLGTWNAQGYQYSTGDTAQIYWVDVATQTSKLLNNLNGLNPDGSSYLPTNNAMNPYSMVANGHTNDTILNYEPTVNPVASGGYAWVIFTSRRLYGNVAVQHPWLSDPRASHYNFQSSQQVTTKKMWVAAIALGATAGTDPSFPAFYLPGQEIQAGNSRGYWVLSPCAANGTTCTSGSACCQGYCSNTGDGGALVCSGEPVGATCSTVGNPCVNSQNCCDTTNLCISGFCSLATPR